MSSIFLKALEIPNFNHSPLLSHQKKFHAVKLLAIQKKYRQSLSSIDIMTAVGLDNIPNKLIKDSSFRLIPVIKDIYNQSLKEALCTSSFKMLNCRTQLYRRRKIDNQQKTSRAI